jgi:hypothetical protein
MHIMLKIKLAWTAERNLTLKPEKLDSLVMEKGLINTGFGTLILIESRKSHSFQSMNKTLL